MLFAGLRSLAPWRRQLWLGMALLAGHLGVTLALIPLARQLETQLGGFQLGRFWAFLLTICCLFLLKNACEYLYLICFARIAGEWAVQLRARAFARLLAADWQQLQALEPDDLLTTLSDDLEKLRQGMQSLLQRLLPCLLILAALAAGLLLISWPLTLMLLLSAPPAAWLIRAAGSALARHGSSTQQQMARLFQELNESLQHGQLIRLYRQETEQNRRLARVQQDWLDAQQRAQGWQLLERPLLSSFQAVAIAILLSVSGWLVQQEQLSGGDLLVYAAALALAVDPALWASEAWGQLQLARPSWDRLKRLLDLPGQSDTQRQTSAAGRLEIAELSFGRGGRPLLQGVSFSLRPGEKIGLSGPSGAGKSTLLSLIAGLETPEQGQILWPADWPGDAVLLVPQRAGLLNRSLRENLCLDRGYSDTELSEVLEICGLSERVAELPAGLDTALGARGTWLSGGEKQRVALARALLRRPRCLLLDESTSELDSALETRILTRMQQARPEMAWLVVSHRRETLQECESLWHLEAGRLVGESQCPPPGSKP